MTKYKGEPEAVQTIKSRRSIRKYIDAPVEWDKIVTLIECGRYAPSSGNIQNFRFIIVTNKGSRQKITEACLNQDWMMQAPVFIVVTSDNTLAKQYYSEKGERVYSVQNCAAAAENILVAATSLGLGSCWVGAFDSESIKMTLGIPAHAEPQVVITIGYPKEQVPVPPTYTIETMTFLEAWDSRQIDAVVNPLGYLRVGEMAQKYLGKAAEKIGKLSKAAKEKVTSKKK